MMGNEGTGMNQNQIDICDHFVYIAQHTGKTASLNLACAGSIILHSFAIWANYQEHKREGYKFVEDEILSNGFSNIKANLSHDPEKIREERQLAKQQIDDSLTKGDVLEGLGVIMDE